MRTTAHRALLTLHVGDARLVPISLGAWIGAWLGTGWGWLAAVSMALGVFIGAIGWVRRSWLWGVTGLVVLGCTVIGSFHGWQSATSPVRLAADDNAIAAIEATVVSEPREHHHPGGRSTYSAQVRLSSITVRGVAYHSGERLLLLFPSSEGAEETVVGATFHASVRLSPPLDIVAYTARAQVVGPVKPVSSPGPVLTVVEQMRQGLRDAVCDHPSSAGALVPALVVGDVSGVSPEIEEDFSSAGLTHLMAVSGANFTLVLGFLGLVSRWLGARGWLLRCISGFSVIGFVLLCRGEPSVIRAAAMGIVGLLSLGGSREGTSFRPLAVAISVLVVVDPWMSRSWGFALSVLATAGIVGWSNSWTQRLSLWLPSKLAEAVAVTMAAQVATLPAVVALSGRVSMVALPANLAAGPLVAPATVLGFIAAVCALPLPGVASALGWLAGWFAGAIVAIAGFFAHTAGAEVQWPAEPVSVGSVVVACLVFAVIAPAFLSRPVLVISAAALALMAAYLGPPTPGWPPPNWRIVACNVGQGDAFVIRTGDQSAILVDTGPDPDAVAHCVRQLTITTVSGVVLTHSHADHIDGLPGVLGQVLVERVFVAKNSTVSRELSLPGTPTDPHVTNVSTGDTWDIGWVSLHILDSPESYHNEETQEESSHENNASLALRIVVSASDGAPVSMLFIGDREPAGQRQLLSRGFPSVDVIAVPHHGSRHQSPSFLRATQATIAIASAGENNAYGHPAPTTVTTLEQLGMDVYRTDTLGAVAITWEDEHPRVITHR